MGDNNAINNLTAAYNGTYWQGANISSECLSSNLVWNGAVDYGFTLNEDAVKEIVEKITRSKEIAKITPDEGPEIPRWTGFLPI